MTMLFDASGQRALVTGGGGAVGAAVAQALAAAGAHVFINYRQNAARAEAAASAIRAAGGEATLVRGNLLRLDEVRNVFRQVRSAGGLDILVHAAALGSFKPLVEVRSNQWDLSMGVDPRGYLLCVREAVDLLGERGGRVVAISSLGSDRALPSYGAIGVAKAAVEATTRYLASELAPRGIRVNAVSAGLLEGSSVQAHPGYGRLAATVVDRTPAGRLGTPEDVARVVLFLCSPFAEWIVGQTIVADGGFSLSV